MTSPYESRIRFGGPVTPIVKSLLIINFSIFILQQISELFWPGLLQAYLGLSFKGCVLHSFVWQPVTYMFLHSGWLQILFNLLALWMFAGELENRWGGKRFLFYYFLTGIGTAVFVLAIDSILAIRFSIDSGAQVVGTSGIIYALLLAYGLIWPNREILLAFIIPVKMKYFLIFFGLLEFFGTLGIIAGTSSNILHVGNLGGIVAGFVILVIQSKTSSVKKPNNKSLFKKFRLARKQKVIQERIKAKETIDTILEKIAKQGMSSLTKKERNDLDKARKYYYPSDTDILH